MVAVNAHGGLHTHDRESGGLDIEIHGPAVGTDRGVIARADCGDSIVGDQIRAAHPDRLLALKRLIGRDDRCIGAGDADARPFVLADGGRNGGERQTCGESGCFKDGSVTTLCARAGLAAASEKPSNATTADFLI